jgi:hypothetical protein
MGASELTAIVLVLRRRPRGVDGMESLFAGHWNAARFLGSPGALELNAISRTRTRRKSLTNA